MKNLNWQLCAVQVLGTLLHYQSDIPPPCIDMLLLLPAVKLGPLVLDHRHEDEGKYEEEGPV